MKMRMNKYLLCVIAGACLGGILVYFSMSQTAREKEADRIALDIALGLRYGALAREGKSAELISNADWQALRATQKLCARDSNHPGVGYWLSKFDEHCKKDRIKLTDDDQKTIDLLKGRPLREDMPFYHNPYGN
jgi:hypothetical protein